MDVQTMDFCKYDGTIKSRDRVEKLFQGRAKTEIKLSKRRIIDVFLNKKVFEVSTPPDDENPLKLEKNMLFNRYSDGEIIATLDDKTIKTWQL